MKQYHKFLSICATVATVFLFATSTYIQPSYPQETEQEEGSDGSDKPTSTIEKQLEKMKKKQESEQGMV